MARPALASDPLVMRTTGWSDYALIDSGGGRKLERYGHITVIRPEPQCLWSPGLADSVWATADAVFDPSDEEDSGHWRRARPIDDAWPMVWKGVAFHARLTAFRHLAVFPEQAANWTWLADRLKSAGQGLRVLNLFGYTGVASLVAAAAGASVTHVDASKKAVAWGKDNAALAGLADAPIRWICEDARKWVTREQKRGARYDAIILDPPKYGRGPGGEVWRLHVDLLDLLKGCVELLSLEASFILLNAYSERISGLALAGVMGDVVGARGGTVDWGELALMEEAGMRGVGLSFFARWSAA